MSSFALMIGSAVGNGRYRILGLIGEGSMGLVFRAYDRHLLTDVVIKFPTSSGSSQEGPAFLERFDREVRSLVHLSHPHIVKILDVGAQDEHPYVVMQYLGGGSLKSRLESGEDGEPVPMPLTSLREWLLDVAKALDFIHSQSCIHRDVKPANILFDRHGNAFLGDFGIIKFLAATGDAPASSASTAPGFLLGTPSYVAPEVVMGVPGDGRVDQYALAMTVHEVLTGNNFMAGPTPSATVVNQTKVEPPALSDVLPGIPPRLSFAVLRALAKDPSDRYESCVSFAQDVLSEIPTRAMAPAARRPAAPDGAAPGPGPQCPSCGERLSVGAEHEGEHVRCPRCQLGGVLEVIDGVAKLVPFPSDVPSWSKEPAPSSVGVTAAVPLPAAPRDRGRHAGASGADPAATLMGPIPGGRRRGSSSFSTMSAWQWVLLGTVLIAGAYAISAAVNRSTGLSSQRRHFILSGPTRTPEDPTLHTTPPPEPEGVAVAAPTPPAPRLLEINIVYGTEKDLWLRQAKTAFELTPRGKQFKINLLGRGSVEGANMILAGEKPTPIHVWSPASSAYSDLFENAWRKKHGDTPILRSEYLALTPMVFVFWKDRYEAFLAKYKRVSFETIAEAMKADGGWDKIAGKPDWGPFKFSHTDPSSSNSGMLALVLMAYEKAGKRGGLTVSDVTSTSFQSWIKDFEAGVKRERGRLVSSTGILMHNMVFKGPSDYDCLLVYENLAIDSLKSARDRHGDLRVAYPNPNMWNEHPYFVLNVPWSGPEERKAASDFLDFLMSEPIQKKALEHGFRPGNTSVPINTPKSPLVEAAEIGIRTTAPQTAEPPSGDVLEELLKITGGPTP